MSWVKGTATDYKDFLNQIRQVATSSGCTVVAINGGGTGYTVGDILTVTGGTKTHTARVRVTSVSSGVINGIVVDEGGAYTANPSNPVSVTGGTGSGATFNLTFASNGWTQLVYNQQASSAAVVAGGTGWTTGNVATVSGGTRTTAATFTVTASAGAITSLALLVAGDYDTVPANAVSLTGAGSGATANITWIDAVGERTLILNGAGSGADNIVAGFRTYQTPATGPNPSEVRQELCYNWGVFSCPTFSSASLWYAQTNITPGFNTSTGALGTAGGHYIPLKTNDGVPITFYLSVTPSRIYFGARLSNGGEIVHYASMYLGFHNRYGSAGDQPYPIHVASTTALAASHWRDKEIGRLSSIVQCSGINGLTSGPSSYLRAGTTWQEIKNIIERHTTDPTRDISQNYTIYPYGKPTLRNANHVGVAGGTYAHPWNDWIPFPPIGTVSPGTPTLERHLMMPTPDGAVVRRMLVPATLIASTASEEGLVGEMDGVYWIASEGLTAEDYADDASNQRYRVFMTGNQKERYHMFALKEA